MSVLWRPARPRAIDDRPAFTRPGWGTVLRRAAAGYRSDGLGDWAAVLTYYAILSISPALLLMASLLGLFGGEAIRPLLSSTGEVAPGAAQRPLEEALRGLQNPGATAGVALAIGAVITLWGASRYVGAFMRAANAVYDTPERRPLWRTVPLRLFLTMVVLALVAAGAFALVLTGNLAGLVGHALGLGDSAILVWQILKWPLIVAIAGLVLAILYGAAPSARHPGFRLITPGSVLAVLVWLVASAGFSFYATTLGDYGRTYGAVAGAVVVVIWLWLSNVAVLLGLGFDAELERADATVRAEDPEAAPEAAKEPKELKEPFIPPRHTVPHPRAQTGPGRS
ncbi:MAG: YihY family inner membrane protein [Streptosporangiales bacterium]|nr:YihY family inner membrane protein [Streptosporangiales bacterium]